MKLTRILMTELCVYSSFFIGKLLKNGNKYMFLIGCEKVEYNNSGPRRKYDHSNYDLVFLNRNKITTMMWNTTWTESNDLFFIDFRNEKERQEIKFLFDDLSKT